MVMSTEVQHYYDIHASLFLTSQMKAVNGVEAGSIQFKTETLVCQLLVQSSPTYSLVLKLQSPPDQSEHWTQEELQVKEKIF